MWLQDVSPEQLAEFFHRYQQILERDFGSAQRSRGANWESMSSTEKNDEVAAARVTLTELESSQSKRAKPYFAPAGEAEWGC